MISYTTVDVEDYSPLREDTMIDWISNNHLSNIHID